MDYQFVAFQIGRKVMTGTDAELQLLAGQFADGRRDLHSTYIFILHLMATGFGDQYPIAILKLFEYLGALQLRR